MIESIAVYYSKYGKDPTFDITYKSGRVFQHVNLMKLPRTAIDFMMFRAPHITANEDVVIFE